MNHISLSSASRKGSTLQATLSGCHVCAEDHSTQSCPILSEAKHIHDSKIPSRARLTLPPNLEICSLDNGSTSVIACSVFAPGSQFGPIEALRSKFLPENIKLPLKVFGKTEEESFYLNTLEEDSCNWMCLIAPATSAEEQNLICYQINEDIFFISVREIKIGEELKVWYAPYYAAKMVMSAYCIALTACEKRNGAQTESMPSCNNIQSNKQKRKKIKQKKVENTELLNAEMMQKVAENLPAQQLGASRVPEKWRCRQCGSQETSVVAYAKHLMKHFKPTFSDSVKTIKCHICQRMFTSEKLLVKHKVIRHGTVLQRPFLLESIKDDDNSDGHPSTGNSKKTAILDVAKSSSISLKHKRTNEIDQCPIKKHISSSEIRNNSNNTSTLDLTPHQNKLYTLTTVTSDSTLDTEVNDVEKATGAIVSPAVHEPIQNVSFNGRQPEPESVTEHNVESLDALLETLQRSSSLTLDDIKVAASNHDSSIFASGLSKTDSEKSANEETNEVSSNFVSDKPSLDQRDLNCFSNNDKLLNNFECNNYLERKKLQSQISFNTQLEEVGYEFVIIPPGEKPLDKTSNRSLNDPISSKNQELLSDTPVPLNAAILPEIESCFESVLNENISVSIQEKTQSNKNMTDKKANAHGNALTTDWELVMESDGNASALMDLVSSSDYVANCSVQKSKVLDSGTAVYFPHTETFSFSLAGLTELDMTVTSAAAKNDESNSDKNKSEIRNTDCSKSSVPNPSQLNGQSQLIAINFDLNEAALLTTKPITQSFPFNFTNSDVNLSTGAEETINFLTSVSQEMSDVHQIHIKNTETFKSNKSESKKTLKDISILCNESSSSVNENGGNDGRTCIDTDYQLQNTQKIDKTDVSFPNRNENLFPASKCDKDLSTRSLKKCSGDSVTAHVKIAEVRNENKIESDEKNFESSNKSLLDAVLSLDSPSVCLDKFSEIEQPDDPQSTTIIRRGYASVIEQSDDNHYDFVNGKCPSSRKGYVLDTGPPYNCDICDKEFLKAIYLYRHLKKHAGEFVCVSCHMVFARKENLISHSCMANKKSNFLKCMFCKQKFSRKVLLRRHMVKHMGGMTCTKCLQIFPTQANLDQHKCRKALQPAPVQCPICRREFRYLNLWRHLQRHRALRPCKCCGRSLPGDIALHEAYCSQDSILQTGEEAECPDCKQKFLDVVMFRLHVFQHTHPNVCQGCRAAFRSEQAKNDHRCKEWLEKCPLCPQQLSSLIELEQHIVSHELPQFHCFECGRSFLKPDALFVHACEGVGISPVKKTKRIINTRKNGLMCNICGEVCRTRSALVVHKQLHGERRYQCDICNKQFHRSDVLHIHKAVHSEPQIPCPVCQKKVKTKKSLMVHMRQHATTHLFKCGHCGKGFNQKVNLNKHLEVHKDVEKRKQACCHCGKIFLSQEWLKVHELKHTQSQPHSCPLCGKTFVKEYYLSNHMKKLHTGEAVLCPFCPLTFRYRYSLRRHLEKRHAEHQDQWNKPGFLGTIKATQQHSFRCPYCATFFQNNNSIFRHLERSHEEMRGQWSMPNFLQSLSVTAQEEMMQSNAQEPEIMLTIADMQIPVNELQKETSSCQPLPESQNQISTVTLENGFVLGENMIVQPAGTNNEEIVFYVLDTENIQIAKENWSLNEEC